MNLKYIVYITINQCNGKFYIGVHKTNPEIFDGCIGCGLYSQPNVKSKLAFHNAVRKYGYKNFKRTTLRIFDTEEEAYKLEAELVTETLIKSKMCYNMVPSGKHNGNYIQQKRVYKFDLNGNFLRSYSCIREAALSVFHGDNIENTMAAIKNCCLGTNASSCGFFWSYTKKFEFKENKNITAVAQYLSNGKFVRKFDSMAEASRILNLTSIAQSLRKKILCGGYQWRYYTNDNDIEPYYNKNLEFNHLTPINMYTKNGDFIKSYNSISECAKENNLSQSQICRVIRNIIKSHKGYTFKLQDKDIV